MLNQYVNRIDTLRAPREPIPMPLFQGRLAKYSPPYFGRRLEACAGHSTTRSM